MFKKTLAATAAGLLAVSLGAGTASAQSADAPGQDSAPSLTGSLESGPLSELLTEERESTPSSQYLCEKSQFHSRTTAPWMLDLSECEENADGEWTYTYRAFKDEFKFLESVVTAS